jgi:hypothetical protein
LNIGLQNEFDLPTSYTISNLLGQTMAQKMIVTSEDLSINTITLTKGVYLITIVKNNERKTIRFIKE